MDLSKVENFLKNNHLPDYRFKQIRKNYFSGRFSSFNAMTDLPLDLRQVLIENFPLLSVSRDKTNLTGNTQKVLLKLSDASKIESVLMDYDGWLTACISSQVGCPLGCTFCATGRMGFKRNLSAEEIVDQILFWNISLYPKYIGRVVFMGMGEPFLNWDNLISSLKIINSKDGLNLGSRKISISTAGIVPRIYDFADLKTEINLAISLHSLDQKNREKIMPITKQYSLDDLKAACRYYVKTTRRQLFFEYAPIKEINDTHKDVSSLIDFIGSDSLFFLNIIPLNRISQKIVPTDQKSLDHLLNILSKAGINVSLRRNFGQSINAACGQLAGK